MEGDVRIRDLCHDPRVSTFDPETGVRYRAEAADAPVVARKPRNPYSTALAAIWITSAAMAVVLVLTAAAQTETSGSTGAGTLAGAGALGSLALLTGLIHLAVLAIAWRPPED